MTRLIFCIFILGIIFLGCDESKDHNYGKVINSTSTVDNCSLILPVDSFSFPSQVGFPYNMISFADRFLVFIDGRSKNPLHFLDLTDRKSYPVGLRGEGPKEIVNAKSGFDIGNKLFSIVDVKSNDIIIFSQDSILAGGNYESRLESPFKDRSFQQIPFSKENIVANFSGPNSVKLYNKTKGIRNIIKSIKPYENDNRHDMYDLSHIQSGLLSFSESTIFFFRRYIPIIEAYDQSQDSLHTILVGESWDVEGMEYEGRFVRKNNKSRLSFINVTKNNTRTFALFTSHSTIQIKEGWNLEGKYIVSIDNSDISNIQCYELDKGLNRIAVIKNRLFGYNTNYSEMIYEYKF